MSIVPFCVDADVPDLSRGVLSFSGSVAFEDGVVEIRYREDKLDGAKRPPKRVSISLDHLRCLDFQKRWVWSKLILEASRIDAFSRIPFADGPRVTLSVGRKDRKAAADLMAVVQTRLDFPDRADATP